jgi:4-hydroxy-tetrahydrodipicolinate synthase
MIKGLHTAIIMPFANGKIDYKKLEDIILFQYNNGVDGIILHGTTGEAPTVTHEEFVESTNIILENWSQKLHITVGISQNSTADVLKKQDSLKKQPHAFLVTPPSYSKPTQEGIFLHFDALAKNTTTPIIVYNVPGRTISDVLPDTLKRIVDSCSNVIGIKDATGSFPRFSEEQFALKDSRRNFSFLTGDDGTSIHFLLSGGNGIVSVVSNILPETVKKMINLVENNQRQEAFEVYFGIFNLIRLLFVESNPIPVKYAMYKMGFCNLEYRLPMCKPNKNLMQDIDVELKKLNLI